MTMTRTKACAVALAIALTGCTAQRVVAPSGAAKPAPVQNLPAAGPVTPGMRIINQAGGLKQAGDNIGAFRTNCKFTHMAADDPIVKPGQPGASHLHSFFGNGTINAGTTTDSLMAAAGTACSGGTANRSGYWVPSIIDTSTGAPVAPTAIMTYYKTGHYGVRNDQVQPPPAGLRMIAGDAMATTPSTQHWSNRPMSWSCLTPDNWPQTDFLPTMPTCAAGQVLNMQVVFPQCWDGMNLDSVDHKSHMAYSIKGQGCPADHPIALPEVSINAKWTVTSSNASWRLASDMANVPAGVSGHADWWNGWNPDIMQAIVTNCLRTGIDCGTDLLGDGRALQYPA